MKRASVAAGAGLLVVAAILATYRPDTWPDPTHAPHSTPRDSGDVSPAVEPESAPPAPQRTPVDESPIFADLPQITLDLRGPDDAPLDAGSIFMDGEGARDSSARNHWRFEWTRAAPKLSWPPTAHGLRAEASSGADDLGCHDLESETIEVDPDLARSADPRLVVRLGLRPGIFGRVQDLAAAPSTRVVSIERSALDGAAHPSEEIARRGRWVMLRRRGDLDATYEIFGLEPGGYFLGLQDELGDVLEPLTSVDVADRMVRVDLSARCREDSSLRVNLIGLPKDDVASVEFVWIDGAAPNGGWSPLRRDTVDATSFRVRPAGAAARNTMRRLLAGELDPREKCALALMRNSEVFAAQPLANGQREVTFEVGPDANLTVRLEFGADRSTRRRIDVVPVTGLALLAGPPAEREAEGTDGTTVTHTFRRLAPGEFLLQVWAPLKSSLHHGEVWWPIERQILTLHAGDQEVVLAAPLLHPLTVRFDRARFGADARIQLTLRGCEIWPRYAAPDERGVARFDDVPAGDCTVAVIGDAAGQVDCKVPETSELTVEPTRRER